jgi:tetratricopeptide (TPR) repeat protein
VPAARRLVEASTTKPQVSTISDVSQEIRAIHKSVTNSTTPFGKRLYDGFARMLRAIQVVEYCKVDGVTENTALLFVEELSSAAKISEKIVFIPQRDVPVMNKLITKAMRKNETEEASLCHALLMMQDPRQMPAAMQYLRQVTRKFSNSAILLKYYATAQVHCGKIDGSLSSLIEAIKVSAKKDPSMLLPQGQCFRMLEQHRKAIASYLACIEARA